MISILPKNKHGCPFLLLAPMEGVGDRAFRRAMATIGGFDQACTEFLRVSMNAHVVSLAKRYFVDETAPIPQAAQLMGSDPILMAEMTREVVKRGAPRVDLNCGCPSNTVTGKGAGSSLLKDPNLLHQVAKSMVEAVDVPVTAKLRSGFADISLFRENLLAAQESGIRFLTLHPRTKVDGYGPPARWDLIAEAKQILKIPLVGNGDILTVAHALQMLQQTNCDALMIGRGSVINPFIFQEVKAHFAGTVFVPTWEAFIHFIETFVATMSTEMTVRGQLNKLKQLMGFLFKKNATLVQQRQQMLSRPYEDAADLLNYVLPIYRESWMLASSTVSLEEPDLELQEDCACR